MTGILITTFNRPEYLAETLKSLSAANLSDAFLMCVDDGSTNENTIELIQGFDWNAIFVKASNNGVCNSLRLGFNALIEMKCEYVMNLDADCIVKPDFVKIVTALVRHNPYCIASGFNTTTPDEKTNKPRHEIVATFPNYYTKRSIGGANMCMTPKIYKRFVEPCLNNDSNWDWQVCNRMKGARLPFLVARPSCVEHIGEKSSFPGRGKSDKAHDFYV